LHQLSPLFFMFPITWINSLFLGHPISIVTFTIFHQSLCKLSTNSSVEDSVNISKIHKIKWHLSISHSHNTHNHTTFLLKYQGKLCTITCLLFLTNPFWEPEEDGKTSEALWGTRALWWCAPWTPIGVALGI
jgi:hypothetical protein